MNKSVCPSLLLCLVSLLGVSSCGGSTSDGGGSEAEFCASSFSRLTNFGGTWRGIATSTDKNAGGIINLSLTQDANIDFNIDGCSNVKIAGAVAFPPCVPVTPIIGRGGYNVFAIQTIGGNNTSLRFEVISDFSGDEQMAPIGIEMTGHYRLDTTNVAGCPAVDTGTLTVEKTS